MFDMTRITLFCLEKRLSKHKMTIFSKNLGGHGPFDTSLATPMIYCTCQPNEFERENKKKLGGPSRGPTKNLGAMAHPAPP